MRVVIAGGSGFLGQALTARLVADGHRVVVLSRGVVTVPQSANVRIAPWTPNGESGPWAPPPPFTGHPHWRDLPSLRAAWSRSEMLAYIDYCRQRVRNTLAGMTDEKAATPLPPAHRYRGQPHARVIMGLVGHTTEHASQIRQFITAAGIAPDM